MDAWLSSKADDCPPPDRPDTLGTDPLATTAEPLSNQEPGSENAIDLPIAPAEDEARKGKGREGRKEGRKKRKAHKRKEKDKKLKGSGSGEIAGKDSGEVELELEGVVLKDDDFPEESPTAGTKGGTPDAAKSKKRKHNK